MTISNDFTAPEFDPANYTNGYIMVDNGWTCHDEFGPHKDHSDCQRTYDDMSGGYSQSGEEFMAAYYNSDSYIAYLNGR